MTGHWLGWASRGPPSRHRAAERRDPPPWPAARVRARPSRGRTQVHPRTYAGGAAGLQRRAAVTDSGEGDYVSALLFFRVILD